MKVIGLLIILVLLAAAAFLIFVRVAPDRVDKAHIDPFSQGATTPKSFLLRPPEAPVFRTTPDALFDAAQAYVFETMDARAIANGPDPLHVTYVVRSRVFRFPDDLSMKVEAQGEGATIALASRSRYAGSDLGVNQQRVARIMDHLAMQFSTDP